MSMLKRLAKRIPGRRITGEATILTVRHGNEPGLILFKIGRRANQAHMILLNHESAIKLADDIADLLEET